MQLYVGPCHMASAQIAVTMVVPIENPADCEVRGVISFLQAPDILGYLAEEASSRGNCSVARQCTSAYCPANTSLADWAIWLGHVRDPPYSPDLAPSDFFLFPKMEHLAGNRFANDDELKVPGCNGSFNKSVIHLKWKKWYKRKKFILFNCYYFEVRLMTLCVEENIVAKDDFSVGSRGNFKLFHNPVRAFICPTLRENGWPILIFFTISRRCWIVKRSIIICQ